MSLTRRTRYTCLSSGDLTVRSAHPPGSMLHCPSCGREVTVTDDGRLPAHTYPTKRERAQLQRQ